MSIRPDSFWAQRIEQYDIDDLLFGRITGKAVTEQTMFLYLGYFDHEKGFAKLGWSSHASVHELADYLRYVLVPTLYYNWIDDLSDGFYMPMSSYEVLKSEVYASMRTPYRKTFELPKVRRISPIDQSAHRYLDNLIETLSNASSFSESDLKAKLVLHLHALNRFFDDEPRRKLTLHLFGSASEVCTFLSEDYGENAVAFSDDTGLDYAEFKPLCQSVTTSEIAGHQFVERLNFHFRYCL